MRRDEVPVEARCAQAWDRMEEREDAETGGCARHCPQCDHPVYNLSRMTEQEARAFLDARAGEDVCVTFEFDEDEEIVFAKPAARAQLDTQRRGARQLVAAAALAIPLGIGAGVAVVHLSEQEPPAATQPGQPDAYDTPGGPIKLRVREAPHHRKEEVLAVPPLRKNKLQAPGLVTGRD